MSEKMEFKKSIIILIMAVFLVSIASVCAADANDTTIVSEDDGIELTANNVISKDNLKTSEDNAVLVQANDDETVSAESDSQTLAADEGNYSDLRQDIENGGYLTKSYYKYQNNDGGTIEITTPMTINGNGAVIDMTGSNIRAFYVGVSGVTFKNLTIKNVNFRGNGGAIYFSQSGSVTNCNFTDNKATGTNSWGGAIMFASTGEVTNCNFADNTATSGGAVYFSSDGEVSNCNFINNSATGEDSLGGAIVMYSGSVSNCNFTNNHASYGGAVYFLNNGDVTNCNFTNNTATHQGGAIRFSDTGTVTNCNFTNNKAEDYGGAIMFASTGEVTNCNFTNNTATYQGGAIFSWNWYTAADTCIFKRNSGENVDVVIYPPTLNVDNFTTFYGSGEKLTFNLTTDSGIPVNNGNISISVYFKDNNSWVRNYSCLSGEGWSVSLPVGYYYANFTTEYAGFQAINRTITITIPNVRYYINVTSLATNNKTVNITAKSDIPKDILWNGKLLFILPNNIEINASYAGDGIWWAVHTFDDYKVYQVNASYAGLDNVTITNAAISIVKANSTVNVSDVVLTYGETKNVTVTAEGATGITAKINENNVTVINNYTIPISGLNAGNYTLTVTTIPDADHAEVSKTVNITVKKADTEITLTHETLYLKAGDVVGDLAKLTPADAGNLTYASGNESVTIIKDGKIMAVGAGQAIITVSFAGNNNYATAENKTILVNVQPADLNLTASYVVNVLNDGFKIKFTICSDPIMSGNLTVKFNGNEYPVEMVNGTAEFTTDKVYSNTYPTDILYEGSSYFNKSTAHVDALVKDTKVSRNNTFTYYYYNDDMGSDSEKGISKINVIDADGNPIKDAVVTIKLGDMYKLKVKTGPDGVAEFTKAYKPGSYSVSVQYDNKTTKLGNLVLKSVVSLPKLSKVSKSAKSTTIKITLKGTGPIKGKSVVVTFMKKQYTIKTDKNGVAQFKLTKAMVSKLGVGKTYKIRATYMMDSVAQSIKILK